MTYFSYRRLWQNDPRDYKFVFLRVPVRIVRESTCVRSPQAKENKITRGHLPYFFYYRLVLMYYIPSHRLILSDHHKHIAIIRIAFADKKSYFEEGR